MRAMRDIRLTALQVGSGGVIRRLLYERDRGVCSACHADCHALFLQLKPLAVERRRAMLRTCLGARLSARRQQQIALSCREVRIQVHLRFTVWASTLEIESPR